MRLFSKLMIGATIFFCLQSCMKYENKPLFSDKNAPQEVLNTKVENLPGGAKIIYSLPEGQQFLYVKAEYLTDKGQKKEVKSSFYENSIEIDGLADSNPIEVKLYTVGRDERTSKPVNVTINPLEPPYLKVFNSIELNADFSGVNVSFKNPDKIDFSIHLMTNDSLGKFGEVDSYYTNQAQELHVFRSYPSEESQFGVFIQDKWGNTSDTLIKGLTPFREIQLDKSKFRAYPLPGDGTPGTEWNSAIANIWDGVWSNDFKAPYDGNGNNWLMLIVRGSNLEPDKPTWFTMDLGETTKLSRFQLNHYLPYVGEAPRKYEIWGATNPDQDGSWDGWTKLISYEQVKPSGMPAYQETQADAEAWEKGDQANFDPSIPEVRYIRIKCIENWGGSTDLIFEEITFWGAE